mmetsp:Transcript_116647/g.341429  ORF Transcript_116647/g.341429 Transcript_116647/m.341429 type:complete len:240 (+) Transcript_116647:1120-1839(+)
MYSGWLSSFVGCGKVAPPPTDLQRRSLKAASLGDSCVGTPAFAGSERSFTTGALSRCSSSASAGRRESCSDWPPTGASAGPASCAWAGEPRCSAGSWSKGITALLGSRSDLTLVSSGFGWFRAETSGATASDAFCHLTILRMQTKQMPARIHTPITTRKIMPALAVLSSEPLSKAAGTVMAVEAATIVVGGMVLVTFAVSFVCGLVELAITMMVWVVVAVRVVVVVGLLVLPPPVRLPL